MRVLGISAFYHDSAAALIEDGHLVGAAQEERFTRKKHDAAFPEKAVQYCLDTAGIKMADVDYVAFYDKPFLKFERLLETYVAFAPRGIKSFSMSIPLWLREKLFLRSLRSNVTAEDLTEEQVCVCLRLFLRDLSFPPGDDVQRLKEVPFQAIPTR